MTIFWPFKNKQTASRGSAEAVGATLLARQVLHLRSEGCSFLSGGWFHGDFTKLPRKMVCFLDFAKKSPRKMMISWDLNGFYQVTQKNGVFPYSKHRH